MNAFECGPGWTKLVNELIADLRALGWTGEPEQVKQKFGVLRFYGEGFTKPMHNRIGEAEVLSEHTCEECGDAGEMQKIGYYVACPKHVRRGWK